MRHTIAKLVPGGKLFIREPLRFVSQDEIRQVMHANGLVEVSATVGEVVAQGRVYEGVFCKPVRQPL